MLPRCYGRPGILSTERERERETRIAPSQQGDRNCFNIQKDYELLSKSLFYRRNFHQDPSKKLCCIYKLRANRWMHRQSMPPTCPLMDSSSMFRQLWCRRRCSFESKTMSGAELPGATGPKPKHNKHTEVGADFIPTPRRN